MDRVPQSHDQRNKTLCFCPKLFTTSGDVPMTLLCSHGASDPGIPSSRKWQVPVFFKPQCFWLLTQSARMLLVELLEAPRCARHFLFDEDQ
jgi:hypothetical protein